MSEKRKNESNESSTSKKSSGFWALGLLSAIKDPDLKVQEDDKIVVIKDKYPKSEVHYLVLPKEQISSLIKIGRMHIPLLKHMEEVGHKLTGKHAGKKFLIGYHAVASMTQLHLHVISNDFNSLCLKTKKHWNSFNTGFFLPSEDVISQLEETGKFTPLPQTKVKDFINAELQCNKCNEKPSNMPKLKKHILTHLK